MATVWSSPVFGATSRTSSPWRSRRIARAGDAEAELDLGADRHPFDVGAEGLDEKRVTFVPAVEAHFAPEQARRDADAYGFVCRLDVATPSRLGSGVRA